MSGAIGSEQSPSFDLALPIPPIASLTPENIADTPEGGSEGDPEGGPGFSKASEERGDSKASKVKFEAPRESTG